MAKYGECISGRPSYQTHRQTYYPTAAAAAAASLNGEAEAVDASGGGKNCSRSGGSGGVGGDGQGGTRFCSRGSSSSATATSIAAGSISQRDPVYPRSLAEEVVWRQRRFAWWGTTYLVDAVSAVPPPSKIHPNPAQLKVQQILRDIRIKDGILVLEIDEGRPCLSCGEKCSGFRPHQWSGFMGLDCCIHATT
ncbi:uncharacterized protein LOC116925356 [Daphnia magna]|uniref:uncharacterized protein LOC116925356 n=1 Tax=Daphnia magna TaxID=35525 RepID=UPI001E1BB213|nr:uncharacterized protein LOC116925356 [Daphnia magna]